MKRKILVIILIIVAVVGIIVSAYFINKANMDSIYITGCEYVQNGEYELAYETFNKIQGYLDTDDLLVDLTYQLGIIAFNEEDYDKAEEYFIKIKDYKDSSSYIDDIYFIKLSSAIAEGDIYNAEKYVSLIPDYEGVDYIKQLIIFEKYMMLLDSNDVVSASACKETLTDEGLKNKATLVYEYCTHGYSNIADLQARAVAEGAQIDINEARCYQYSYNNNVEVPVYMFYTEYTDAAGNSGPRYVVYLDHSYYGYCNTIVRSEIDMKDEAQLYAFLKIEPYWDAENTLELSVNFMKALNE